MSESAVISPLLDGFSMGDPMFEHDGIVCCPAIKDQTGEQYIVKVISVPATQSQLDALILAGACKDTQEAMEYFRDKAEAILKEAELLKKLSRLTGFRSYDDWQMSDILKRRLGYLVYLLGPYRLSLDKYVRQTRITHAQAMTLALDLCSALMVCRQAGALYVDLKPSNIFFSEEQGFEIGDLGFVSLDSLDYTVIPKKYCSAYTPQELLDPMAKMNLTVDTYAVGLILYQLYNDGQLPPEIVPDTPVPFPVNADYELATIILRAIHPNHEQRYNDPAELGQALVTYMQANQVTDDPITHHIPLNLPDAVSVVEETSQVSCDPADALSQDETSLDSDDADDLLPHEMSDELSKIVAKADDLISHETPEGVILPEAPAPSDPFAFAKSEEQLEEAARIPRDPVMPEPVESSPDNSKKKEQRFISPEIKRRRQKILAILLRLVILTLVISGGLFYYLNIYLKNIDGLIISSDKRSIQVTVRSQLPDELLTVLCQSDTGKTFRASLENGTALFSELQPATEYTIYVEIAGFHKLTGSVSSRYATKTTTEITSFTALAGHMEGTAVLSFETDGEEPNNWILTTSTEGMRDHAEPFVGHSITLSGLTVGQSYTFSLEAGGDMSVSGVTSLSYIPTRLIEAQDVSLFSAGNGDLEVQWKAPGDLAVESWNVRCHSSNGYDETVIVKDMSASFVGLKSAESYTLEIVAAGMTHPSVVQVTKEPARITDFRITDSADYKGNDFSVQWELDNDIPAGGYLVTYTIDGSSVPSVVETDTNSVAVSPRIPGSTYVFTIKAANNKTVINGIQSAVCPDAEPFLENKIDPQYLDVKLLKTPSEANWRCDTVDDNSFTDQFSLGEPISVRIHASNEFYRPGGKLDITYVIRSDFAGVVPELVGSETVNWNELWSTSNYHYGKLNLPFVPSFTGDFTLELYFNGKTFAKIPFRIA